jgi:hypothetical protein
MNSDYLARIVADHYLRSDDFNGIPLSELYRRGNESTPSELQDLIREGILEIVSSKWDPNPHIKRLPSMPREKQLATIRRPGQQLVCVYPSPSYLEGLGEGLDDADRPFTTRLRKGEPQLQPTFFEPSVLERYHSDPRYEFEVHNFGGHIAISGDYYESDQMPGRDKVIIQSFGYGRTEHDQPVVVVFLRYLSRLTSEHQKHWQGHQAPGSCRINSDYRNASVLGNWGEGLSIYEAFLEEFFHVNEICGLMGRPPLFRDTFRANRPRGFGPLLRPTRRNCEDFIHLLDKMLSENIDRQFFVGVGLRLEEQISRASGGIESRPKGSVRLLTEWLKKSVHFSDPTLIDYALGPMKWIRKLRRNPAHKIQDDRFDTRYYKLQERILIRGYRALQCLRLILSSHPTANGYRVSAALEQEKIALL